MTLALIGLFVLAIAVFGFVLEPILRARSDQTVLDAAALPEHGAPLLDDEPDVRERGGMSPSPAETDERHGGLRMPIDRPAGSDAS